MNPITSNWSVVSDLVDNKSFVIYYVETSAPYQVYVGDRYKIFHARVIDSGDVTDFENNYKSAGINTSCEECAIAEITSGVTKIFNAESLADGVYEDSLVVACDGASKTFNIENNHATGGLKYRIWGSPDNSDWEEIKSETVLAAQTKTSVANNDMWKYVKISAKGDGAASTVTAYIQIGQ